jgi:predicted RNA-binding Zn-ribbon protein involved in translation (DUF1610 family)
MFEFLQRQVDDILGPPSNPMAHEVLYMCPKCGQPGGKKHLSVNYEVGLYRCWKCSFRGSILYLAKYLKIEVRRPPADWSKSIRNVFAGYRKSKVDETYDNTLELEYPCDVQPIHAASKAMRYLNDRGVSWPMVNHYQMVESVGDSKWRNRIFIPSLHEGYPVYWVARSMDPASTVRYLTPVDIDKRYYIFNLHEAKKYDYVVITEGVFDAIAVGVNAVALLGKHASESQINQLVEANFDKYVICLDSDACGDAEELAARLDAHQKSVYMVSLPTGKDPADTLDIRSRITSAIPFEFSTWASERIGKLN